MDTSSRSVPPLRLQPVSTYFPDSLRHEEDREAPWAGRSCQAIAKVEVVRENAAAGQGARACSGYATAEQKRPAVSLRLIAGAPVALVDHARAERPGLDQV
jgi:hypothetical protein